MSCQRSGWRARTKRDFENVPKRYRAEAELRLRPPGLVLSLAADASSCFLFGTQLFPGCSFIADAWIVLLLGATLCLQRALGCVRTQDKTKDQPRLNKPPFPVIYNAVLCKSSPFQLFELYELFELFDVFQGANVRQNPSTAKHTPTALTLNSHQIHRNMMSWLTCLTCLWTGLPATSLLLFNNEALFEPQSLVERGGWDWRLPSIALDRHHPRRTKVKWMGLWFLNEKQCPLQDWYVRAEITQYTDTHTHTQEELSWVNVEHSVMQLTCLRLSKSPGIDGGNTLESAKPVYQQEPGQDVLPKQRRQRWGLLESLSWVIIIPSPFYLIWHAVACVSIFLPDGIGPLLPRPPTLKKGKILDCDC